MSEAGKYAKTELKQVRVLVLLIFGQNMDIEQYSVKSSVF